MDRQNHKEAKNQLTDNEFSAILSKCRFASFPELRLVSKRWNSHVIPTAAVLRSTESGPWKKTMIFSCGFGTRTGPCFVPIWFRGSEPPLDQTKTWEWGSPSINPVTSPACISEFSSMHPSLFASEGGLLFFTLNDSSARSSGAGPSGFLVCNPLTGTRLLLTMPSLPIGRSVFHALVGVEVSGAQHGYKLVVGRFYTGRQLSTISVYDSLTSSWKLDIQHAGLLTGDEQWNHQGERSISHDGSVYWFVQTGRIHGSRLMKDPNGLDIITYNVKDDILNKFKAPALCTHRSRLELILGSNPLDSHIVSEDGELLTAFVSFIPRSQSCFTGSGLCTGRTHIEMSLDVVDKLWELPNLRGSLGCHYSGFRHKEIFYHIVVTLGSCRLKIVAHDTAQGSVSELNLDEWHFPERHFWAFSPSWTASP